MVCTMPGTKQTCKSSHASDLPLVDTFLQAITFCYGIKTWFTVLDLRQILIILKVIVNTSFISEMYGGNLCFRSSLACTN